VPRQRGGRPGPRRAHMLRMQILRHHLRHRHGPEQGQLRNRPGEEGPPGLGRPRAGPPPRLGPPRPGERPPRPAHGEGEGHRGGIRV
jgi:hypothetical protein